MINDQRRQISSTISDRQAIRSKDWAAGPKIVDNIAEFKLALDSGAVTGKFMSVRYIPAARKAIDEIITNSIDHLVRTVHCVPAMTMRMSDGRYINLDVYKNAISFTGQYVTYIRVTFDKTSKKITVTNNGFGIVVVERKQNGCSTSSSLEATFSINNTGTNAYKTKTSIIGGINGIGAKVTNALSVMFSAETVDSTTLVNGKYIKHRIEWNEGNVVDHKTCPVSNTVDPYTEIAFKLDEPFFVSENRSLSDFWQMVENDIENRTITAALYADYLHTIGFQACKVTYNGEHIKPNIRLDGTDLCAIDFVNPNLPYKWSLKLGVTQTPRDMNNNPATLVIINGLITSAPDMHKRIVEIIKAKIKANAEARDTVGQLNNLISAYITYILIGAIPDNNISFASQSKDKIIIRPTADDFAFEPSAALVKFFKSKMEILMYERTIKQIKSKKCKPDKYTPAACLGSRPCTLILIEGDSAMYQFLDAVPRANNNKFPITTVGILSTGGVPMNIRRRTKYGIDKCGKPVKYPSQRLLENNFFRSLLTVNNMDVSETYENPESIKKLKYSNILVVVDEDTDGTGNIFGLIMSGVDTYWPSLIKHGYIRRLETPRIRAISKKDSRNIYNDAELEEWRRVVGERVKEYTLTYYKGLGSNTVSDLAKIIKDIGEPGRERIVKYEYSPATPSLFNAYYGHDASLRRDELRGEYFDLQQSSSGASNVGRVLSCDTMLRTDVRIFQKDNINRKIPSYVDGFNEVQRKIYDALMCVPIGAKRTITSLSSAVKADEGYLHGEDSLNKSIIHCGFTAPGYSVLPMLVIIGNGGSRTGGPDKAGAPRYLSYTPNPVMSKIFRQEDYRLLRFRLYTNDIIEPHYFVPIVPWALMVSQCVPSHGWKIEKAARDFKAILSIIRRMIYFAEFRPIIDLAPNTRDWTGSVVYAGDIEISRGRYSIVSTRPDSIKVRITELPQGIWTMPYIEALKKTKHVIGTPHYTPSTKQLIIEVNVDPKILDVSSRTIESTLTILRQAQTDSDDDDTPEDTPAEPDPEAKEIEEIVLGSDISIDPIEHHLGIAMYRRKYLNHLGPGGEVRDDFNKYTDVLVEWFKIRKELYKTRVNYDIIMAELELRRLTNICRYLDDSTIEIRGKRLEVACAVLHDKAYERMDTALINTGHLRGEKKKFVAAEDLKRLVMTGPGADYMYLLKLTDYQKTDEAKREYFTALDAARAKLDKLTATLAADSFPGASVWLEELDELEESYDMGVKTAWKYKNYNPDDDD